MMHRSIALLVFALSCASAFPVVFLTYEEGKSQGSPRLFDCVSVSQSENSVNAASKHQAYRCRPNARSHEHLKVGHNFPIFEILEEPVNEVTAIEVEEIAVPALPLIDTFFPSSKIVVANGEASNANTNYDVDDQDKPKRNRGGCANDEVFVAELDLCMPFSPQQSAPKTATINDEEKPIPVEPDFTILEVGFAPTRCSEGEIFLPSVGICVPANNCYPYPSCDAYNEAQKEKEKEKEKKKNKNHQSNQRAEEDDD
ncbi:uncharacterized protein LOC135219763 [Macrobrachium nipponense]|uniref:uncharacterized protein LOC135219763 n=1 Tax=Macrobrachium nipponense TaxID=159736 RepID=UPI0030C7BDCD